MEVEHEPIGALYSPRRYFRSYASPAAILEVPEVRDHVERLRGAPHYVETGWPVFAALPLLAERFPARLRVVHLSRHPVPASLSHVAHGTYAGSSRNDAYTRLATLGPDDPGVVQRGYEARWRELAPYEKCLFWWTEVSLFGLEFEQRYPRIPFLRLKSEDMLSGDRTTLERLVAHLGLPPDARWAERARERVDRWPYRTPRELDPLAIRRHPLALATMARLGYSLEETDVVALRERYSGPSPVPGRRPLRALLTRRR